MAWCAPVEGQLFGIHSIIHLSPVAKSHLAMLIQNSLLECFLSYVYVHIRDRFEIASKKFLKAQYRSHFLSDQHENCPLAS